MTRFFKQLISSSVTNSPALLGLLVFHAVWIAGVATVFTGSIGLDVAEGVIGGPEWQLSYIRHPPFSTWLIGLLVKFASSQIWAIFLLGEFLVLSSLSLLFWFLAKNSKHQVAWPALAAYLVSPFATYFALQVNHNLGVMPFRVAVMITAWYALERARISDWVLLGASVGFGLWAKYQILLLVLSIIVLSLFREEWRKRWLTSGPWIAIFISSLVISPHIDDISQKGFTTLFFALKHDTPNAFTIALRFGEFLIDVVLFNLGFAIALGFILGYRDLIALIKSWISKVNNSPFDFYLLITAIGPVAIVLAATFFGVRPRIHWFVPMSVSFISIWARITLLSTKSFDFKYSLKPYLIMLLFVSGLNIANRYADATFNPRPLYAEMDGKALSELIIAKWKKTSDQPIPYLISFGSQHGRQAAGSVAFRLPYLVKVLEDNNLMNSPWIDIRDLAKKGGVIIAPKGLPTEAIVAGRKPELVETINRPMLRGAQYPYTFEIGVLPPLE